MRYLKQSTTATIQMGPFLDKTDGVTEETGLTPAIEVSKGGAAFAARNSGTAVAHDTEGWYRVELDTTDTATLGTMICKAHDNANHLPVWHEFMVLPANVYDSMFGSDKLQVDLTQIDGLDTSGNNANLNLKTLNVTNGSGTAVTFEATGSGNGLRVVNSSTSAFANGSALSISRTKGSSGALSVTSVEGSVIAGALEDLRTLGLDHLLSTSVAGSDVADNSIIAKLVSASATADWDTYDNTTDSLQANQAEHDATQTAVGSISVPSAASVADAVWEEAIADHSGTAGSTAEALDAVGGVLTAGAIADAVWDETRSDHVAEGSFGQSFAAAINGQAATGTLSTTQATTNLTEATDNHYNDRVIVWVSGVLAGQACQITDYDGATKMLTYTTLTEAPSNGDKFVIV